MRRLRRCVLNGGDATLSRYAVAFVRLTLGEAVCVGALAGWATFATLREARAFASWSEQRYRRKRVWVYFGRVGGEGFSAFTPVRAVTL